MLVALPLLALASLASATLPALGGYNLAGLEFGVNVWGWTDGRSPAQPPPMSQIAHFASAGANLVRIPFAWQYIQPVRGSDLDAAYLKTLDSYVQAALSTGAYVILDDHNYGRVESKVVGLDGPSNAEFGDLWSRIATKYAASPKIIFGLMNEPHDMNDFPSWVQSLQAAVNAIRQAGANSQHILLPGNDWTHVQNLISSSGPAMLDIKDPAGGTDKLVFDAHQYLDADGSGTNRACTTDNVALLQSLDAWLSSVGRQAILTETGGGNNEGCVEMLGRELAFVASHTKTIAGFAVWSAGSFDTNYELSIVPDANGQDNDLAKRAVFPNFPKGTVALPAPSGAARRRHRSPETEARWNQFRSQNGKSHPRRLD